MPRRVLDTNILINHWGDATRGVQLRDVKRDRAARWGRELAGLQNTNLILTPIYIEFVCGNATAHELQLARAYLGAFEIADGGTIHARDWIEARRIAERVPRDGRRRQLGDCLIRAICDRLNLEVFTAEKRFPGRLGATRRKG
jgi:predicted nucleic acid-binding protein